MHSTIEMGEGTPNEASPFGFVRLLVVPAIALAAMLTLTLGSPDQQQPQARTTFAEPSRRQVVDEAYTLYIYAGDSTLSAALNDAFPVRSHGAGLPLPDWYARVDTPAEEAELMKAWEHANWIRHESGLPAIGLVDLRLP
jgi:hypothetical protein